MAPGRTPSYTARLAAGRADEVGIAAARSALDRMHALLADLRMFPAADREFHDALATMAGNSVLNDQLHVVQSLLRVYTDRSVDDETDASRAIDEHRALLGAVVARDADLAVSAMAIHMATASARLLAGD